MGETLFVAGKLRIESNPFDVGDGNGRLGRPLQKTLGEVIRQIGLETPVVVVPGSTGTGKTLLAKMAERICADMGLSIRRIHRGDFVEVAGGQRSDVLLVDESDFMPDSTLHMLLFEGEKRPATTTVLLCLPSYLRRFSTAGDVVVVELTRLSQSDTRHYLQERATQAGLPNLFTSAAFDLIVDGSRGVPRSLWSIASLAYFYAASKGAAQISREHVAQALASQIAHPEASVAEDTSTPVGNSQRTSANVALFKGGNSAELPTPQMPISKPQESPVLSGSEALTQAELMKLIAAASDPSVTPDGELPIDSDNVEGQKSPQSESIGIARANADKESAATRLTSVIIGSAAAVAIALAAAVALMIFVQPASPDKKAGVATGAKNIAVTAPAAANPPSTADANPPDSGRQTTGKGNAANKTAGLPNSEPSAANPLLISPEATTTRSTRRTRRTRAASAAAPQGPTTPARLLRSENGAENTTPFQAGDPAEADNPKSSAEADAIAAVVVAAQQRAERDRMANEAAAQAQAAAIREAGAKNRANALAEAAALAAKEERERKVTKFDFKPKYRLYQ